MKDLLPFLLVLALGLLAARVQLRPFRAGELRYMAAGLGAHVFAALAQVWITKGYYGSGDMLSYHRTGSALAQLLRTNPERFFPEVVALVFQREVNLPVVIFGQQGPTGSMQGISGLLCFGLGDSLYTICLLIAFLSFFGKVALYRVFRATFQERLRPQLLVACLLIPSVVFWTSGLLKEAVAFPGFCFVIYGIHRLMGRFSVAVVLSVLLAALPVALVKPYILIALAVSASAWWYWRRALLTRGEGALVVRPLYLVVGGAAAVGAVAAFGNLFPTYAFENIAEETAQLQEIGARVEGGSNYLIGDPAERSLAGQLAFAPVAVATALFRPFLFEVSGATMLLNTLETTVLTLLFAKSVLQQSWKRLWSATLASPTLMFCVVFSLTFGAAVGLASTNLGTLSRYRVPLVPLFAAVVLVWNGLPRRSLAARPRVAALAARRPPFPNVSP